MPYRVAANRERSRHYVKEWRKHLGLSQAQLADRIGTSVANLSRIESGKQPYTQDFLEAAADAMGIEVASLIMRNPDTTGEADALWSLWEQAKVGQRKQIVEIVKTILKTGTDN